MDTSEIVRRNQAKYRAELEAAMVRHGCVLLETLPNDWARWSTGNIPVVNMRDSFFIGPRSFNIGLSRTSSRDASKYRWAITREAN